MPRFGQSAISPDVTPLMKKLISSAVKVWRLRFLRMISCGSILISPINDFYQIIQQRTGADTKIFGCDPFSAHNGDGQHQIFLGIVNGFYAAAGFEAGIFAAGGNRFQYDVSRFRRGGNFGLAGRGFDEIRPVLNAQFCGFGDGSGMYQFSGFKNHFEKCFFAEMFFDLLNEKAAFIFLAFQKLFIRKTRSISSGAFDNGGGYGTLGSFQLKAAVGKINDGCNPDIGMAQVFFGNADKLRINADGGNVARKAFGLCGKGSIMFSEVSVLLSEVKSRHWIKVSAAVTSSILFLLF